MNWFQRTFAPNIAAKPSQNSSHLALEGLCATAHQTADSLIHRAHKRANSGDVLGALADFEEAIQCNPARATAYFNRGFLHNTLGNFEAAIEDFNQAVEFLIDYDEVYYQRGTSYFHLKNLNQALEDFNQAIQLNSFSIKSYYKRAEIYIEYSDTERVLANYAEVLVKLPNDANAYHHRGVFLAKIGQLNAAIADFSSAIANSPKHSEAYCSRGCCYAQLGELENAQQDFSQALSQNPSSPAAYYQQIYGLPSTPKGSETDFEISVASHAPPHHSVTEFRPLSTEAELPELPTIPWDETRLHQYFERANQRAVAGDSEGAIAEYTQIIELDPKNTQAYYHRGQQLNTLGYKAEAIEDLDEAIHWARVHSLGLMRDFSGVLSDTLETLKSKHSQPQLTPISTSDKRSIEATIADCSQLIQANSDNATAYFERARSRALMGDLRGAIADYTETLRLNPHYAEAHYRRALSYSALGNRTAATYDFQRAILYKPLAIAAPSDVSPLSHQTLIGTAPVLSLSTGALNTQTPTPYAVSPCDHADNDPENRFCVHCGQSLWSTIPRD